MLRRAPNKNKIFHNPYLRAVLLIVLLLVGFVYIWQMSQVSTQGYYLKDLERQVSILEKRNEKLQLEASRLKALPQLEEKVKQLGMVKNDTVYYLSQRLEAVAFKQ